jgi:hypothetical protein
MDGAGDHQLNAAIKDILEEIRRRPIAKPRRPAYPDRSRMGIKDADK